jgi:hypothetical protein
MGARMLVEHGKDLITKFLIEPRSLETKDERVIC